VLSGALLAAAVVAVPARAQDAGPFDASSLEAGVPIDGGDGGLSPAAVIATYCNDPNLDCTTAPLAYDETISLPVAFDFDTGWVPSGSPLQVRFYVQLPADTEVKLAGSLDTRWPTAMTLSTPGDPDSGLLSFDYGLNIGAQAKIDVNILGVQINWTGAIPYTPQFDFLMQGEQKFDSWAFAPNSATAQASTPESTLFHVDLLSLAGIPSVIASGGVGLDVQGDLSATYTTDRIRIEPAGDTESPILSETGSVQRSFAGGPYVEYDVWPEGTVHYDGTLHLIPTFYFKALGQSQTIPVTNIPIPIALGDQSFVFDPVRVHVPLPDIPPIGVENIDFGRVTVGKSSSAKLTLKNHGEARARAVGVIPSQYASTFSMPLQSVVIDPSQQATVQVDFTPPKVGDFQTKLTFVTNDPDTRFQYVTLQGEGVEELVLPHLPTETPSGAASNESAGCGCRLADPAGSDSAAAWALLAAAAWVTRRRRRVQS
jgi:MYXO-CTERM domain-containing protein